MRWSPQPQVRLRGQLFTYTVLVTVGTALYIMEFLHPTRFEQQKRESGMRLWNGECGISLVYRVLRILYVIILWSYSYFQLT
jgi:hypothetical protein